MSTGVRLEVQIGAAYYIPIVVVPGLVVGHLRMFPMLLRRSYRDGDRPFPPTPTSPSLDGAGPITSWAAGP